jgi:hypothetical protein
MPILSNFGIASSGAFGFASTTISTGQNFIGYFTNSGTSNFANFNNMGVDGANNIFITGSNGTDGFVFKVNPFGVFQFAKTIANSIPGVGCVVGPSGNIYVAGSSAYSSYLGKLNNNASAVQFTKYFGTSSGSVSAISRIFLDKTETYLYTIGARFTSGSGYSVFWSRFAASDLAYSDSGSYISSNNQSAYGVSADSSGNVYLSSLNKTGTTNQGSGLVWKTSTSLMSVQWAQLTTQASGTSDYTQMYATAVDSSGNVYAVGTYFINSLNETRALVTKYSSGGSVVWTKQFLAGASGARLGYTAIAIDPASSYIYCYGDFITKLDTSGNVIFHRSFSTTGTYTAGSIYVDSIAMYICQMVTISGTTGLRPCIAKLPLDGSKTGTYTVGSTSFTYSSITPSSSTTNSSSSYSLTTTSPTYADGSGSISLSDVSSAFTNTVI